MNFSMYMTNRGSSAITSYSLVKVLHLGIFPCIWLTGAPSAVTSYSLLFTKGVALRVPLM